MRDMTFADRATDAAKAGRQTRERAIDVAASAYLHDVALLRLKQPANWHVVSHREIAGLRTVHEACLAHLDELERLIAQRDGMTVTSTPILDEMDLWNAFCAKVSWLECQAVKFSVASCREKEYLRHVLNEVNATWLAFAQAEPCEDAQRDGYDDAQSVGPDVGVQR